MVKIQRHEIYTVLSFSDALFIFPFDLDLAIYWLSPNFKTTQKFTTESEQ